MNLSSVVQLDEKCNALNVSCVPLSKFQCETMLSMIPEYFFCQLAIIELIHYIFEFMHEYMSTLMMCAIIQE